MIQGFLDFDGQPAVVKKFKHGDIRCDGYRFMNYQKRPTGKVECWLSPKAWSKYREHGRRIGRKNYLAKKEERTAQIAKWAEQNKARVRAATKAWYKRNPDRRSSKNRKRYVKTDAVIRRMPANHVRIIDAIYSSRKRVSDCVGAVFHVDHVIPLSKGGTHSAGNLQIIPWIENLRKGSKVSPLWVASRLS